jgi:hypothetical protein
MGDERMLILFWLVNVEEKDILENVDVDGSTVRYYYALRETD